MNPPKSGRRALLCIAFAGLAATTPALADELQDAQALMRQGQARQALEVTEKGLAAKPRDAQLRFLKGLILTEMNRQQDAIAVFSKLTEDFPELPEPYNNLAVIYAQQRQFDKAKSSLEMAIRTHPSYATAHENLGDIYARLASQAYDKALQLDSSNVVAQTKLAMIRDLISVSAKPASAKPAAARPAPAATPAAAPQPPAAVAEARPVPPQAKPAPEARPQPAEKRTARAPEASGEGGDSAAVGKAIRDWAAAWSRKDVKAYLAHYARDFHTPARQPRAAWEKERERRIDKPGTIEVAIDALRIEFDGADRATARFHQDYRSANIRSAADKVLQLVRRDGRWLIVQEQVGR